MAAKEFAKGPVVVHLAASGDLERLGTSFANQQRFKGPRPPEEVLVPFSERSEEEQKALRCASEGLFLPWKTWFLGLEESPRRFF